MYAVKIQPDGEGEWITLDWRTPSYPAAAEFAALAEAKGNPAQVICVDDAVAE